MGRVLFMAVVLAACSARGVSLTIYNQSCSNLFGVNFQVYFGGSWGEYASGLTILAGSNYFDVDIGSPSGGPEINNVHVDRGTQGACASESYYIYGNGPFIFFLGQPAGCGGLCSTNCQTNYLTFNFVNNSPATRYYQLRELSNGRGTGPCNELGGRVNVNDWSYRTPLTHNFSGNNWGTYAIVGPGGTGTLHVATCDTNDMVLTELVGNVQIRADDLGTWLDLPNTGEMYTPPDLVRVMCPPDYSVTNSLSTPPDPNPPGSDDNPNPATWTNRVPNIQWGPSGTNGALDTTMKDGFEALYDGISMMNGTLSRIEHWTKRTAIAGEWVTNNWGSMALGTNSGGYTNGDYVIPSWTTNGAAALSEGRLYIGSADGAFATGTNYFETASAGAISALSGAGSPLGLSFTFCGQVINLDPEVRFPGMMGLIKAAWTFVILALFGIWAGNWAMNVSKTVSSAAVGGVPDLELSAAGFGGNFLGFSLALLVPVAFAAIWAAVAYGVVSLLLETVGLLPDASTGLGLGGNQIALYLLNGTFPVSLALSCIFSRMSIPFLTAKVTLAAAVASRFLLGR